MGELSPWHLLILAAIFVVLFGSKKLPDAARSVGRSMRILKAETKGLREDSPEDSHQAQAVAPAPIAAPTPVAAPAPVATPAQVQPSPTYQPAPVYTPPPTAPVIIPPGATAPPVPAPDNRS
jgi:sec-independent protein translocase protein TatA